MNKFTPLEFNMPSENDSVFLSLNDLTKVI